MKRAAVVFLVAAIAWEGLTGSSCATTGGPQPVTTVRVEVPVPVRCKPDLGPPPAYPDTDAAVRAAPGLFARVQLLVAGRLMRIAREGELTAAVRACEG